MGPFTDEEIRTFILEQQEELHRHCHFLWEVYRSHHTQEEAVNDWAIRYAKDYREIGGKLFDVLHGFETEDRIKLFHLAMNEIMKHKFIESEKINHDIGLKPAGMDWIENHSIKWLVNKIFHDQFVQ